MRVLPSNPELHAASFVLLRFPDPDFVKGGINYHDDDLRFGTERVRPSQPRLRNREHLHFRRQAELPL